MRLSFSLAVLACGLSAAEPLLTLTTPDGARMRERFEASVYGKVWNDPAAAPIRAKVLASIDEQAGELGFKPSEVIAAFRFAGAEIDGFIAGTAGKKDGAPQCRFVADFAEQTAPFFTFLSEKADLPAIVAGADAAFASGKDGEPNAPVFARFGTTIVGSNIGVPAVFAPLPSESDLALWVDSRRFAEGMAVLLDGKDRDEFEQALVAVEPWLGETRYDMQLVPEGLRESWRLPATMLWLVPVDRTQLDRLPATTMTAIAVGVDGSELWKAVQKPLFDAVAREEHVTAEEAEAKLNEQMASELQIPLTISELVQGLSGTWAFAVQPSAPFPAASLLIPRSPAIDQLVGALLVKIEMTAPEDGASVTIPVPGAPVALGLARRPDAWLLTTDTLLVSDWAAGTSGGFLGTPAAKVALERGGPGAVLLGCSDTATVLRTITPYLSMALGGGGGDPESRALKQAGMQLLTKASQLVKTGYIIAKPNEGGMLIEQRGILTYGISPLIMAGIAIPNLLESRVVANEAAVTTSLKSGLFPAQIQFQSGAYADADGDGVGEYGFFEELAGGDTPTGMTLSLMDPRWNAGVPEVNGYHFAIYLPDGQGGAISTVAQRTGAAKESFLAYAWPIDPKQGRRCFAISADGIVYFTMGSEEPAWNALWGGGDAKWGGEPAWQPYRR